MLRGLLYTGSPSCARPVEVSGQFTTFVKRKDMNTHKNIAKYLLYLIEDEGLTNLQSRIVTFGTSTGFNAEEITKFYFNGEVLAYSGNCLTKDVDMYFCVYDLDGDYMYDYAKGRLEFEDFLVIKDVSDQRVYIFPVKG